MTREHNRAYQPDELHKEYRRALLQEVARHRHISLSVKSTRHTLKKCLKEPDGEMKLYARIVFTVSDPVRSIIYRWFWLAQPLFCVVYRQVVIIEERCFRRITLFLLVVLYAVNPLRCCLSLML